MASGKVVLSKDSFDVSVNKLRMYFEEEEKILQKFITNFENMTSGYVSSSTTLRTEYYLKIKNSMNRLIENRQKELQILDKVGIRYRTIASNSVKKFDS